MPSTNSDPKTFARQDLKNLYYFLSNNLGQIANTMNDQQKLDLWKYYQMVEGLHNQALFIGLLSTNEVNKISEQIKSAKLAAERMLLNMQDVVANLHAFKAAIDLIQEIKKLPSR